MSARRFPCPGLSRVAAWIAVLLLPLAAARAQITVNVEMAPGAASAIRFTSMAGRLLPGGFLPVRVRIENRADEARAWEVDFTYSSAYGSASNRGGLTSTFRFAVPAGITQETVVFVPIGTQAGGPAVGFLSSSVRGPEVARPEVRFPFASSPVGGSPFRYVATPAIEPALRKLAAAEAETIAQQIIARTGTAPARAGSGPVRRLSPVRQASSLDQILFTDPAQWPADWRTWSQFNALLTTEAAWKALDPARQRAVRAWVALGGRLILFPAETAASAEVGHGLGFIATMDRRMDDFEPTELIRRLHGVVSRPGTAWTATELIDKNDPLLNLRIGGRWLGGFLVGFAVLVGPVNLFYFAAAGRRHRLFFTVPLMSAVGTAVLVTVVVLSDGFGGRGHRQALVCLLPEDNAAVVVQRQVARTGLLFRRGFALAEDTDLQHRPDGASATAPADLVREQDEATGDWFASRRMQDHALRRITPTRARVDLVDGGRDGRAPVLQSSVGTLLRSVRYRDAAGGYWKADELPPGQRITLQSTEDRPAYGPTNVKLEPGSFFAEGGAGDLAPLPTLASINWTDQPVHYTGRVGEAAP